MSNRKDKSSIWLIVCLLLVIGTAAFMLIEPQLRPRVSVAIGDGLFKAQVVQTAEQRNKGLSGVDYLKSDEAMLFLFDSSDKWSMWMKNMKIPLDIVWLDQAQKVVYIVKNASPDDFPKSYVPNDPALYVLELGAGVVDAKNIRIGSKATFNLDEARRVKG
ncbi:hypothetical protein D3C85_1262330 [compost metagenome]